MLFRSLETLEEIDIRGRKTFFDAGGKNMTYIPCLNDSEDTINLLENILQRMLMLQQLQF